MRLRFTYVTPVLSAFPPWNRSIATGIHLHHPGSCQEILTMETPGQGFRGWGLPDAATRVRLLRQIGNERARWAAALRCARAQRPPCDHLIEAPCSPPTSDSLRCCRPRRLNNHAVALGSAKDANLAKAQAAQRHSDAVAATVGARDAASFKHWVGVLREAARGGDVEGVQIALAWLVAHGAPRGSIDNAEGDAEGEPAVSILESVHIG
eukprot:COSAG01_NODE_5578_length_4171_cov_12.697200_5_plen_209_part_00